MKERLTGAAILLAVIVLLVPALLRGPVHSSVALPVTEAGGGDQPPLRSYTIDLADGARPATAPQAAPQPAALSSSTPAAPSATTPDTAVPPAQGSAPAAGAVDGEGHGTDTLPPASPAAPAAPVAAPQPAVPHAATAPAHEAPAPVRRAAASVDEGGRAGDGSGAWVVQLGSFASKVNAERLARQVTAQGYHVRVSQGNGGRRLYRVRVGPAPDRAAAERLASRLRAQGHAGEVVPR
ncbi:MAG: SPOR domain-containing protein [Proteobacteria bacterium]|nr:SPOR domain-containing protein [Pseudomonadota bacterium]